MIAVLPVYMDPRLKELAGAAADKEGIPLSEFFTRAVAEKLKRLDLAVVQRKRPGRRRKVAVAS